MRSNLMRRIVSFVSFPFVIGFILFEELVWEGVAKPLYRYVHTLNLVQKLESHILNAPASVLLIGFIFLIIGVELLGVYAAAVILKGYVVSGAMLYLMRLPLSVFTFWFFKTSKVKLLRFGWFRFLYEKIIFVFAWIKSTKLHQNAIAFYQKFKEQWRVAVAHVKKTLKGDGALARHIKVLYRRLKKKF